MAYKDPNKAKEYMKAYYQANKEQVKASAKAYYEAHKEQQNASVKAWRQVNKEYSKAYYQANKEQIKASAKAYYEANKEQIKDYIKSDINANGETKHSIRKKSRIYLSKYGTKIPGYQIHHCCTYAEPYKFIYCSREMHRLIHSYLRAHNIDADSNHYELIKHLLDDTAVLYGIE